MTAPGRGWVDPERVRDLPAWLAPVVAMASTSHVSDLTRFTPPPEGGRPSAVLMLFGDGGTASDPDPDLLMIERAHDMRSHAGQPAFPGGSIDSTDTGPIDAALREANEETGIDPDGVVVFGVLPDLFLPPSGFVVTPVLGWWREPSPFTVVDTREVASVHRVRIGELADPVNRLRVRHPAGHIGPGFRVRELLVWGFTAGLIDRTLALTGWERHWDDSLIETLEPLA